MNPWEDHEDFPSSDWQDEVANGNTRLGYAEWVQEQRDLGDPIVTCDGCDNTSEEGGWGDTAFCTDCHLAGRATEGDLCRKHLRTYVGSCPICADEISDEQAIADRVLVSQAGLEDRLLGGRGGCRAPRDLG